MFPFTKAAGYPNIFRRSTPSGSAASKASIHSCGAGVHFGIAGFLLGTLEGSLEVDRLQAGGPILDRFFVRLRSFFAGPQNFFAGTKFQPADPHVLPLFHIRANAVFANRILEFMDDVSHRLRPPQSPTDGQPPFRS